ncbi:hypothetical protein K435DRAFT_802717 [Dendrothele bispora CBS 962.96]|uniref:Uncharacterized protein n=1 Tax=Dendrothele bispora (strain CBS 962.96) TaxID=1314807 RepID=A0A4S8LJY1_DENBC|nr:hypothetical protein K435DRAFT_802717 [Dendrothele bispora CBS 962.96]
MSSLTELLKKKNDKTPSTTSLVEDPNAQPQRKKKKAALEKKVWLGTNSTRATGTSSKRSQKNVDDGPNPKPYKRMKTRNNHGDKTDPVPGVNLTKARGTAVRTTNKTGVQSRRPVAVIVEDEGSAKGFEDEVGGVVMLTALMLSKCCQEIMTRAQVVEEKQRRLKEKKVTSAPKPSVRLELASTGISNWDQQGAISMWKTPVDPAKWHLSFRMH